MRWIVGGRAVMKEAASTSQMALPNEMASWSLTTLREKVVKIGQR
jgi:hypothetical protein